MSSFSVNWRLMGLLTVATLVSASLFLPQRLGEMRTGLVEHFLQDADPPVVRPTISTDTPGPATSATPSPGNVSKS